MFFKTQEIYSIQEKRSQGYTRCRPLAVGKVHSSQNRRRVVPFPNGKWWVLQDSMFLISHFLCFKLGAVPTSQLGSPNEPVYN